MTYYWRSRCPKPNNRTCSLISRLRAQTFNFRNHPNHSNNNPMMTRRIARRNSPGPPLVTSSKRTKIWNNPIHFVRSNILLRILLRILSQKPSPHTTNLLHMTPTRNSTIKPVLYPPSKYSRPSSLWSHSNLGPPQPYIQKQHRGYHRPNVNKKIRTILHLSSTK